MGADTPTPSLEPREGGAQPAGETSIDWVAPPFAGHLFPILGMATRLSELGFHRQRVISLPSMRVPAEAALAGTGIPFLSVLPERDAQVSAIANAGAPVGMNPRALLAALREGVSLLTDMRGALLDTWGSGSAPDLVIADSLIQSAGPAALECGARWWTSLASIPSMEASSGTPSYVGGWRQRPGLAWRLRDAAGRSGVRGFKRIAGRLVQGELRGIGLDAVYRADGSEACYSAECILGLGVRELEFPRQSWPAALEFVGPVLESPTRRADVAPLEPGAKHVLITLGTHLVWAKDRGLGLAIELGRELARGHDRWIVHFSRGDVHGGIEREVAPGVMEHSYVPYGAGLARFDAVMHHGGAGVMYSTLGAGVPALVWPHDFDQFDHAARLVQKRLGLRAPKGTGAVARSLRRLEEEPEWRQRCGAFGDELRLADPGARVAERLGREIGKGMGT